MQRFLVSEKSTEIQLYFEKMTINRQSILHILYLSKLIAAGFRALILPYRAIGKQTGKHSIQTSK